MSYSSKYIKIIVGADKFGSPIIPALLTHLRSLNIEFEYLGTFSSYYAAGVEVGRIFSQSSSSSSLEIIGLVACGTGIGVAIFANKFPGVCMLPLAFTLRKLSTPDQSTIQTSLPFQASSLHPK